MEEKNFQEELEVLRKVHKQIQQLYALVRLLRSDLEKISNNYYSLLSTMAALSRKSLGAVRFDVSEFSPVSASSSPSRRRRSIAITKVADTNIEENDDEAERLARRERNDTGSPGSSVGSDRRQSSFNLASISYITAAEMNSQIAQCIKLSAENKINDKNAFQLKMIDFLVYALKKQDPNMSNLQMASVSLDASAKIYGYRVDKVYSDLLKVIGMAKQDKRDNQDENRDIENGEENSENSQKIQKKEKKKRKQQNILSTEESLKGTVETFNPWSLAKCQRDTQTSDLLFQAGFPQHANQGIALNVFNDVCLDKIESNSKEPFRICIKTVDDNTEQEICSSYANFKFLGWLPEDEPEEPTIQTEETDGEHRFDLDGDVPDDNFAEDDGMMDCDNVYEERCDQQGQNRVENIVDFQEIIANNPNPNETYEYSYLRRNYRIQWAGPSHWKITLNKNLSGSRTIETCKQNVVKKKKEIELTYTADSMEESKITSGQNNKQTKLVNRTIKQVWSEDKITFPEDIHYDLKRYSICFNKPTELLQFAGDQRRNEELEKDGIENTAGDDDQDISNYGGLDDFDNFGDNNEDDRVTQDNIGFSQGSLLTQTQGAFIGDNLVAAPKMIDKIFIPYSQRAKKIDMRQLKKVMWKDLKKTPNETEKENFDITQAIQNENNNDIEPKDFSTTYLELPKHLSKANAASLSPAIAFVTLLHLANEKNLVLERNPELSELTIKNGKL